jgi:hypothetical protein
VLPVEIPLYCSCRFYPRFYSECPWVERVAVLFSMFGSSFFLLLVDFAPGFGDAVGAVHLVSFTGHGGGGGGWRWRLVGWWWSGG